MSEVDVESLKKECRKLIEQFDMKTSKTCDEDFSLCVGVMKVVELIDKYTVEEYPETTISLTQCLKKEMPYHREWNISTDMSGRNEYNVILDIRKKPMKDTIDNKEDPKTTYWDEFLVSFKRVFDKYSSDDNDIRRSNSCSMLHGELGRLQKMLEPFICKEGYSEHFRCRECGGCITCSTCACHKDGD